MNKEQAAKILMLLGAYYETWKPGKETLNLYQRLLMPLDAALVEAAITQMFNQSHSAFVPKVGEIISLIATATLDASERPAPSPEEAWALVYSRIESLGYYRGPGPLPPAIRKAVDAIGFQRLCMTDNLEADRAHFFRIYGQFREKAVQGEIERLTGDQSLALKARAILEIEHEQAQARIEKSNFSSEEE